MAKSKDEARSAKNPRGSSCLFRGKDYGEALLEELDSLWTKQTSGGLVDLEIVCQDRKIKAHKVVMAAASTFFREKLCQANVLEPVMIKLEDFGFKLSFEAVQQVVEFVYRGEVTICSTSLGQVAKAAHQLGIHSLKEFLLPFGSEALCSCKDEKASGSSCSDHNSGEKRQRQDKGAANNNTDSIGPQDASPDSSFTLEVQELQTVRASSVASTATEVQRSASKAPARSPSSEGPLGGASSRTVPPPAAREGPEENAPILAGGDQQQPDANNQPVTGTSSASEPPIVHGPSQPKDGGRGKLRVINQVGTIINSMPNIQQQQQQQQQEQEQEHQQLMQMLQQQDEDQIRPEQPATLCLSPPSQSISFTTHDLNIAGFNEPHQSLSGTSSSLLAPYNPIVQQFQAENFSSNHHMVPVDHMDHLPPPPLNPVATSMHSYSNVAGNGEGDDDDDQVTIIREINNCISDLGCSAVPFFDSNNHGQLQQQQQQQQQPLQNEDHHYHQMPIFQQDHHNHPPIGPEFVPDPCFHYLHYHPQQQHPQGSYSTFSHPQQQQQPPTTQPQQNRCQEHQQYPQPAPVGGGLGANPQRDAAILSTIAQPPPAQSPQHLGRSNYVLQHVSSFLETSAEMGVVSLPNGFGPPSRFSVGGADGDGHFGLAGDGDQIAASHCFSGLAPIASTSSSALFSPPRLTVSSQGIHLGGPSSSESGDLGRMVESQARLQHFSSRKKRVPGQHWHWPSATSANADDALQIQNHRQQKNQHQTLQQPDKELAILAADCRQPPAMASCSSAWAWTVPAEEMEGNSSAHQQRSASSPSTEPRREAVQGVGENFATSGQILGSTAACSSGSSMMNMQGAQRSIMSGERCDPGSVVGNASSVAASSSTPDVEMIGIETNGGDGASDQQHWHITSGKSRRSPQNGSDEDTTLVSDSSTDRLKRPTSFSLVKEDCSVISSSNMKDLSPLPSSIIQSPAEETEEQQDRGISALSLLSEGNAGKVCAPASSETIEAAGAGKARDGVATGSASLSVHKDQRPNDHESLRDDSSSLQKPQKCELLEVRKDLMKKTEDSKPTAGRTLSAKVPAFKIRVFPGPSRRDEGKGSCPSLSCSHCQLNFSSKDQLQEHLRNSKCKDPKATTATNTPIICQICKLGDHKDQDSLKIHICKTHGLGKFYRCEDCSFETSTKSLLTKHVATCHPEGLSNLGFDPVSSRCIVSDGGEVGKSTGDGGMTDTRETGTAEHNFRASCKLCSRTFKSKVGYNLHMKQHTNSGLNQCMACDFKTPQLPNLVKHLATKHRKDVNGDDLKNNISCSQCEFRCVADFQLKGHILRKHTSKSDMRYKCSSCTYATVEKSALDKHIRFRHTNERPFLCNTCGFSTHTRSAMVRHRLCHTGDKPYKCKDCGSAYADRKRLRDHERAHLSSDLPFSCDVCGFSSRRKDNLRAHIARVHPESAGKSKNVLSPNQCQETPPINPDEGKIKPDFDLMLAPALAIDSTLAKPSSPTQESVGARSIGVFGGVSDDSDRSHIVGHINHDGSIMPVVASTSTAVRRSIGSVHPP